MNQKNNEKNWQCVSCKKILGLEEAKEHAKNGDGYHACYPIYENENHSIDSENKTNSKIDVPLKHVTAKKALSFFLINPSLISSAILSGGKKDIIKKKWMELKIKTARKTFEKYGEELKDQNNLLSVLKEMTNTFPHKEINNNLAYHVGLYLLIRTLKPRIAIETGVAAGDSSALILLGMHDNNVGELYSIDLPFAHFIDSKGVEKKWIRPPYEIGYTVPDFLRKRWHLVLGDSNIEIPKLLKKLGSIDYFHHDDEEIRMKWQFEQIIPHLTEKGTFSSDDINLNNAFQEACEKNNFRYVTLWRNSKQPWGAALRK